MFVEITRKNSELLQRFISTIGKSGDSFRYFKSRPISIINNHLCTVILMSNNEPIGYGHLDQDNGNIWLGIAIAEPYIGQGHGNSIMEYLISKADELRLEKIQLSVDIYNLQAIKLYNKFGFVEKNKTNDILFFERILSL